MQEIARNLSQETGDMDSMRERLIIALKFIAEATSQLVEVEEDNDQKALSDNARYVKGRTANELYGKNLICTLGNVLKLLRL